MASRDADSADSHLPHLRSGGDGNRGVCEDEQEAGPHHEYVYRTCDARALVIFLANNLSIHFQKEV
jgi:hypothetical protein